MRIRFDLSQNVDVSRGQVHRSVIVIARVQNLETQIMNTDWGGGQVLYHEGHDFGLLVSRFRAQHHPRTNRVAQMNSCGYLCGSASSVLLGNSKLKCVLNSKHYVHDRIFRCPG